MKKAEKRNRFAESDSGSVRGKVLFLPKWLGNPYLHLLSQGVEGAGWDVVFDHYPEGKLAVLKAVRIHSAVKAVHLHWTQPLYEVYLWRMGTLRFRLKATLLLLDIWLTRLSGRRVIWTVHNQVSHESSNAAREILLNRMLSIASTRMIFHSENAQKEFEKQINRSISCKSSVIPHGNYIGWYSESCELDKVLRTKFGLVENNIVLLVFGAVRRYKGIPALLEAFSRTRNKHLRLIVAGRPFDDDLLGEIESLAEKDARIKLHLGFIPDEEVAPLFSISDAALFGFERTLTSGSALLGMSFGLPLVMPDVARVLGVASDEGAWFYSDFDKLTSLFDGFNLKEAKEKGAENRKAAEKLDWSMIGDSAAKLYAD